VAFTSNFGAFGLDEDFAEEVEERDWGVIDISSSEEDQCVRLPFNAWTDIDWNCLGDDLQRTSKDWGCIQYSSK